MKKEIVVVSLSLFLVLSIGLVSAASEKSFFASLWEKIFGSKDVQLGPIPSSKNATPVNFTNASIIRCIDNSQCPPTTNHSCNGAFSCTSTTNYVCVNPGTPQSFCEAHGGGGGCQLCALGCIGNGQCINNQTNQTHRACVNNMCTTVSGAGANECSYGACVDPQHDLRCINNACTLVPGTGTAQCSPVGSNCTYNAMHYECVNRMCALVNGSGPNLCTNNVQCENVTNNLPDLLINSLFATYKIQNGSLFITSNFSILNNGTATSPITSWTILITNPTGFTTGTGQAYPGPISPGQTVAPYPITSMYPQPTPGTYLIEVTADPLNEVPESNENNNKRSFKVVV